MLLEADLFIRHVHFSKRHSRSGKNSRKRKRSTKSIKSKIEFLSITKMILFPFHFSKSISRIGTSQVKFLYVQLDPKSGFIS
jgi:hypothetical protein